jgi:hypothetical protein
MDSARTLSAKPSAVAGGLAEILSPISLDEFFARYWSRRPLHLRGQPDRLAGLFSRAEFDEALPRCQQLKAGFYDDRGWYCELAITPEQVKRLWEARMTICAGVLPAEGSRKAVIEGYRRAVALAGEVYFNAYMSPDGQGFTLHIDDHPVFIFQIEGVKRWWISSGIGVPDPIRGFSFPPDRDVLKVPWGTFCRPDETEFLEITLEPGDALYLPAGVWHKARAIGFSLALTMASSANTPLDLAQQAIVEQLSQYPVLYHRFWGADARELTGPDIPPHLLPVLEAAAAAVQDLARGLNAEVLYRLWRTRAERADISHR